MVGREGQDPEIAMIFRGVRVRNERSQDQSEIHALQSVTYAVRLARSRYPFSFSFTDSPFRLLSQKAAGHIYIYLYIVCNERSPSLPVLSFVNRIRTARAVFR